MPRARVWPTIRRATGLLDGRAAETFTASTSSSRKRDTSIADQPGGTRDGAEQGTYGKWQYIPSKNAFIAATRIDESVWLYRLSEARRSKASPVWRGASLVICLPGQRLSHTPPRRTSLRAAVTCLCASG